MNLTESGKEAVVVGALLSGLMGLGIMVRGDPLLITRPLWLDEYHTFFVASASLTNGLRALAAGADVHPPLLYLLLSPLRVTGTLSPSTLRLFSVVSVILGLLVVYLILRRHTLRAAAFGAVIALWAHPLLLRQTFEGRTYGPLVLFAALMAFSVGIDRDLVMSRRRDIALAVSSALLCTIHYFGVFAWGLIAATTAASWLARRELNWRRIAPVLAGPFALLACLPVYLGQREAFGTLTWIPQPTAAAARNFIEYFYLWLPLVVFLLIGFVLTLLRPAGRINLPLRAGEDIWSLISLFAVPFLVIAVSILVQPALIHRYGIATLLAFAPVFAIALSLLRPVVRYVLLLLILIWFFNKVGDETRQRRRFVARVQEDSAMVVGFDSGQLIIGRSPATPYALRGRTGEAAVAFPMLTETEVLTAYPARGPEELLGETILHDQIGVQAHSDWFGFPSVVASEEIRRHPEFWLLENHDDLAGAAGYAAAFFPEHRIEQVRPRLYRLTLP